jgi:LPS O-antigen subunit length determinant protein (WzzB/FepE family)
MAGNDKGTAVNLTRRTSTDYLWREIARLEQKLDRFESNHDLDMREVHKKLDSWQKVKLSFILSAVVVIAAAVGSYYTTKTEQEHNTTTIIKLTETTEANQEKLNAIQWDLDRNKIPAPEVQRKLLEDAMKKVIKETQDAKSRKKQR